MPLIEAGGGLVVDDAGGRVLMIFRNGRWDLPKGKLEPGERIEECAVREVSARSARLRIARTATGRARSRDTYPLLPDRRAAGCCKRTSLVSHALRRRANAPQPQTVEGITRAEWIERERVPELLERHLLYNPVTFFGRPDYPVR